MSALLNSKLMQCIRHRRQILVDTNYLPEQGMMIDTTDPKWLGQKEAECSGSTKSKDDPEIILSSTTVNSHLRSITECSICLESYNLGDSIVMSVNPDCNHVFHTNCIFEWLRRKTEPQWKCPNCRQPIVLSEKLSPTTESV
jgi:hypothetical protein